jgi:hypothetical protein
VKDGINDAVVHGDTTGLAAGESGTKVAARYSLEVAAGGTEQVLLRLTAASAARERRWPRRRRRRGVRRPARRVRRFYAGLTPPGLTDDAASVMRQALAGMLWTKQYYSYDVSRWLSRQHGVTGRFASEHSNVRNAAWYQMVNDDVISMPDKWEYPWYAAWDLAFHCVPSRSSIPSSPSRSSARARRAIPAPERSDPRLRVELRRRQPARPRVGRDAGVRSTEQLQGEAGDVAFLERPSTSWRSTTRGGSTGRTPTATTSSAGGFLGLDNIGVFDRSSPLPTGGHLEQADGTSWMAFYSADRCSRSRSSWRCTTPSYEPMASKFFEHFLWIAGAMDDPDDPGPSGTTRTASSTTRSTCRARTAARRPSP